MTDLLKKVFVFLLKKKKIINCKSGSDLISSCDNFNKLLSLIFNN